MLTDQTPPAPRETPLFSAGKKIIFLGALLVWGGFFLPWFPSITITGPQFVKTGDGFLAWKLALVTQTVANRPGGAEIPFLLGWVILGMTLLIVILPDAWPSLGLPRLKFLSLCALIIGAATLAYLFAHNPGTSYAINPNAKWPNVSRAIHFFQVYGGLLCNIAGYVLLLIGLLATPSRNP